MEEENGQPEKTFTQAEVDKLIKDRLDRERKKYADYDQLKEKAEKLGEVESNFNSELERMKQEFNATKEQMETLQSESKQYEAYKALVSYQNDKGLGIRKDAYEAAIKLIEVNEDGVPNIETLIQNHPFLLEVQKPKLASPTNGPKTVTVTTDDRRAKYFGGVKGNFFAPQSNVLTVEE